MRYIHLYLLILFVALTGCGNDEEFTIKCEISGLDSRGVEMYYTTRGVQRASFHPVDGKVTLRGASPDITLVEVFTIDNEPLFTCVARNGDELEVKMDLQNPGKVEISGNDASKEYAAFISENNEVMSSRDAAAINRLVAEQVRKHPDRISSAMLLVTKFAARGHELTADSLVNMLKPEARPTWVVGAYPGMVGEQVSTAARGNVKPMTLSCGHHNRKDTVVRYWPSSHSYSILVFIGTQKGDSVRRTLKELTKDFPKRRLEAVEVSVMGDSAIWAGSIRNDSARWPQAWVQGGVANTAIRSLQIPSVPFFIVADSTGHQIYRGSALSAANDSIRHHLAGFAGSGSSEEEVVEPENDNAGREEKEEEATAIVPNRLPPPSRGQHGAPQRAPKKETPMKLEKAKTR
ncbi:MAG: hypothetical protein NC212_06740 [Staphylococcus sp.]|nr:hypothetical protein [Staphylococcus sp.]